MATLPIANDNPSEGFSEEVQDSITENRIKLQQTLGGVMGNIAKKVNVGNKFLAEISQMMAQIYNIDQQKLLADAEQRLEDKRLAEQEEANEKKKTSFIGKLQGGLFDILKKVFLGAALVGAVMFVVENWEGIVEAFKAIKPYVVSFAGYVADFAVFMYDLMGGWEGIALTAASIYGAILAFKAGRALYTSTVSMIAGYKSLNSNIKEINKKFKASKIGKALIAGATAFKAGLVSAATATKAAVTPLLVAAAPIVAIAAAIALTMYGINEAFKSARDKFEETGSIWLAIEDGISQFIGTIIGFPIKLLKDAVSWVASSLGFEQFAEDLDSFDPVANIKKNFTRLMRFIYDPETGKILGTDFSNLLNFSFDSEKFKELMPNITFDVEKFKQFFRDLLPKQGDFLSKFVPDSVYDWLGEPPSTETPQPSSTLPPEESSIDDASALEKEKRTLEQKQTIAKEGLESGRYADMGIAAQVRQDAILREQRISQLQEQLTSLRQQTGAEIDVRSRDVEAEKSTNQVVVTNAPTNVQNVQTTNQSSMTVTPATPRRTTPSPQARDYSDPTMLAT
jgi:hypothetical protein